MLYDALRAGTPNLHLVNLGCGGESTASMLTGGTPFDYRCGYGKSSQLEQAVSFLEEHAGRIAFVTIDIGANDLLATGGGGVPAIAQNLPTILDAVRDAAGPTVRIVGMNYYDPFVAAVWFETQSIAALQAEVASTAGLNDFLEGIYATFDMPVADVESAFQLHDFTLVDGTPLNVVRACQWTWMCAVGDIQANDDGYRVIAEAFLTVVS